MRQSTLQRIAVDLTEVLPEGKNGGAKVFALKLVAQLAASYPTTQFLLLTSTANHVDLASFDRE
jgi:hypothetical protein